MKRQEKIDELREYLSSLYPTTKVFLEGKEDYQFLIAVILSAQSQDKNVNKVTPILFNKYPSLEALAKADLNDVVSIIRIVGLGNSKAKNIIALSQVLIDKYQGLIPSSREELETLPGVGHKTAGVFLAERRGEEFIPVDTHIMRISSRLGITKKNESPDKVEEVLENGFKGESMINFHRQMIFFGRNICLASTKRKCEECPFSFCKDRKI